MSCRLRIACRIDLVLVTLLCLVMTGCIPGLLREQQPEKKRVVYLGIEKATPALEQAVADRVEGYERVSAEEYRETARKLKAETMTDLDVARVAHALDVDVIIHGRYVRKNKRRGHLAVTMRTAEVGAVVGEYVIPVRRGAMTKRGERRLDGELRAQLEALLGPPVPASATPATATASVEATPDQEPRAPEDTGEEATAHAAPAPAQAAPKPARGAKPAEPSPRASEEPTKGRPVAASKQAGPTAPAPVIHYDDNGQVIDDEEPPGLK